jgi:hypothetical protein
MKKRIVILIVVLLVISSIFFLKIFSSSSYDDIYEDNNRIVSVADSYSYRNRVGESKNKRTKLSFKLTGMETLWAIKSDYNTNVRIEYSSQVKKGQLKLVIIHPDDTIKTIFEGSGANTVNVPVKKGTNRIKIVGKNATGEIDFTIQTSKDLRVVPRN